MKTGFGYRVMWMIGWVSLMLTGGLAQAAITVDGYFRLGEDDPGAAAGQPGQDPTREHSGLTVLTVGAGTPTNTSAVSTTASSMTSSTLAMQFDGTSYYTTNGALNSSTDNYGCEAWFNSDTNGGTQAIFANGDPSGTYPYGLALFNGWIGGLKEGVWFINSLVSVTTGVWTHAAFVVTNGQGRVYVNGALCVTQAVPAFACGNRFSIGTEGTGVLRFKGAIDEVRVFHFASGAFRDSDLLYAVSSPNSTPYTRMVLRADPVAYYRMDETVGPGMFDLAVAPAPSAQQGAQTAHYGWMQTRTVLSLATNGPCSPAFLGFEAGNKAHRFSGTGGASPAYDTDFADVTLPAMGTNYTVEGWMYNSRANNESMITGYFVSRGTSSDYDAVGIGGTYNGAPIPGSQGKLFVMNNPGGQAIIGTTVLALNTWYHVALVRSGTTVSLYLNGVLETSGTMTANAGTNGKFTFGYRPDKAWSFKGALDEWAIFDRALSASEVLGHYTTGLRGPPGTVVCIQ